MKTTVDADALADALKTVKPAAGYAVHLAADNDLTVTGTADGFTISTIVPATVHTPGTTLAGFEPLRRTAEALTGDLTVTVNENVTVTGTGTELTLATPDPDMWPNILIQPGTDAEISADTVWGLKKLLPFSKPTDSRPNLAGIRFENDWAAATDGIALATVHMGDTNFPGVTVPGPALHAVLQNADSNVTCSFTDTTAAFTVGPTTWITRLVQGNYPSNFTERTRIDGHKLQMNRDDLHTALNVVTATQPELGIHVIPRSGTVTFKSRTELGTAEHTIPADGDIDWPFQINPKYLREILPAVREETVEIRTTGQLEPLVIREGDFGGMFMPIRGNL